MSETRVFLDRDLRRLSSYEIARSFHLSPQVALSSSSLPLSFDCVSAFYGVSSSPFASLVSSHLLSLSIQRSLSSGAVSYDQRLAHAAGLDDDGPLVVDLRPPMTPDSDQPRDHPAEGARVRDPQRPEARPSGVSGANGTFPLSGEPSNKAGAEGSADGAASAAGGPRPPSQSDVEDVGLEEVRP